jgi:S-adenosylmethionine:tRNA ribosyltransferase-isomerase
VLTSDFDYELPPERIAQRPAEPRDRSRLMIVRRGAGTLEHRVFADLPAFLNAGDLLVRNVSRVVPARLLGHRADTGGKWEGLFLRERPGGLWELLAQTRGKPRVGETIAIEGGLRLVLEARESDGRWLARPDLAAGESTVAALERVGHVPLPPYVRKGVDDPSDRLRYQTVFARDPGSVAAPTAGLHFTDELLERLENQGVGAANVTLHVGIGTFRPIEVERIDDHALHAEWAELTAATADQLNQARDRSGRIVAVGTTSTRTLETSADAARRFHAFEGETALYLKPGHVFRGVDALITNFHLPRSSLLVLVSALAGLELTRFAYAEAIRLEYRFYSYGDAMLVLP